MHTESMRRDYTNGELHRRDLRADPGEQFDAWFAEAAREPAVIEANAMTLATVDAAGRPHARIVLLKDRNAHGYRFFTNYESDKAREIAANAAVALVFHWQPLERQVRIEGVAERIPREESDAYFQSRPAGSRLGAWASPQSRVLPDRAALETRFAEAQARFGEGGIPMPPHWGGYVVRPEIVEFWQGRRSRLHDRFRYRRDARGSWIIERLAP